MMMMFIGTETLVTQLENERSRVHATALLDGQGRRNIMVVLEALNACTLLPRSSDTGMFVVARCRKRIGANASVCSTAWYA